MTYTVIARCARTGRLGIGTASYTMAIGFVALGSMLASEKVLDALVSRFEAESQADLEDRLLAALEAGRDAGA